jgi:hypothetical protein
LEQKDEPVVFRVIFPHKMINPRGLVDLIHGGLETQNKKMPQ